MDEKAQIGLLLILETKTFRRVGGDKDVHVNTRVIAATNEDLQQEIAQKRSARIFITAWTFFTSTCRRCVNVQAA